MIRGKPIARSHGEFSTAVTGRRPGNEAKTSLHATVIHPTFAAVSCMPLTDPLNGAVTVVSTTFNSQANYTCNSEFVLVGDSSRTCQANATWTGEQPICELKHCKNSTCVVV